MESTSGSPSTAPTTSSQGSERPSSGGLMPTVPSGRGFLRVRSCGVRVLVAGLSEQLTGVCGPFTDVAADVFCPFVLEIFCLGITTGTSPTTYDPTSDVTRLQMAAFLSRTVDTTLKRGSRRAAL